MYLDFFGLQEKPFSLTPDPRFLFLSDSHRQALDHMVYGIQEREGFILIAGDIGTGKTTICRELLERLEGKVATALILNPLLSEQELLEAIVEDFALASQATAAASGSGASSRKLFDSLDEETQNALELNPLMPGEMVLKNILEKVKQPSAGRPTKKELIDRLNAYLLELVNQGGNAVLIIDEAQNLSSEVLEQVRILSNLETTKQKLLQIVLVGQLELKRKLESSDLRQLNQRITIRYQLNPLTFEETKRYIEHRLFVAGSNSSVTFGEDAFQQIYDYSRGVPRLVNLICERCLLAGYVDQVRKLDGDAVIRCRESLEGNMQPDTPVDMPAAVPVQEQSRPAPEPIARPAARGQERPQEAVEQPWERKGRGLLSGPLRMAVLAVLVIAAIAAASFLTWKIARRGSPPAQASPAATQQQVDPAAQKPASRPAETPAVRLAFSLQLGAFRTLEDAQEQARLFSEQGLELELYVVPLHVSQLGGRWYRLFYGGFPSSDAGRAELNRLEDRGIIGQGSARVVETSLAFNLGDFGDRGSAEQKGGEYMRRWRIPSYAMKLEQDGQSGTWRLYSGAFENREQSAFLGDRIGEAGLSKSLVERLGYWKLN